MPVRSALIALIIFSSVGPYIAMGLRMEHLVIYPLFIFYLLKIFAGIRMQKPVLLLAIPLLLTVVAFIIADLINQPGARMGSYFSSLDNVLLPVALFVIFSILFKGMDAKHLKWLMTLYVYISVGVALLVIISTQVDLNFIFRFFVPDITAEESVWAQSLALGRYLGVFTQPLEAGIFFSLALFTLIYLNRVYFCRGSLFILFLVAIIVGGVLSLSKNFYLLGIVLSIVLWGLLSGWSLLQFLWFSFLFLLIPVIGIAFIADDLGTYLSSLQALYDADGLIAAVTAGRFDGSGATGVEMLFKQYFNESPLWGFGLGTYLPLDNGFLEFAYQGGFFAFLGYLIFLLLCSFFAVWSFRCHPAAKMLFVLFVYMMLASLGGPVITANRTNIILVFLISALTFQIHNSYENIYDAK